MRTSTNAPSRKTTALGDGSCGPMGVRAAARHASDVEATRVVSGRRHLGTGEEIHEVVGHDHEAPLPPLQAVAVGAGLQIRARVNHRIAWKASRDVGLLLFRLHRAGGQAPPNTDHAGLWRFHCPPPVTWLPPPQEERYPRTGTRSSIFRIIRTVSVASLRAEREVTRGWRTSSSAMSVMALLRMLIPAP